MAGRAPKPKKPYRDFPLSWHPSGTWCKKIKGKLYYFGSEANRALENYLDQKDDLQAGRLPRVRREAALALLDACNLYLTAMRVRCDRGEITRHTFGDYHTACGELLAFFGKQRAVGDLRPVDFARYAASPGRSGKTRNLTTFGNLVIRTRMVFNWLYNNDFIPAPVKFGTEFRVPSRADKAKARAKRMGTGRMIAAEDIRRALGAARQPMRSMILLGINCGFGQNDCASLPLSALDLKGGWITFPRPKTGTERRCPLWPETVESIRDALRERPAPKGEEEEQLVFLTHRGARWVRHQQARGKEAYYFNDFIAPEFNKLLTRLGIKRRGSFYNLRHAFRTAAGRARDREAIDVIMGHADQSMGAFYVEDFDDDRLTAVTDCVRRWLHANPDVQQVAETRCEAALANVSESR